ncbi:MAG: hypothetical protein A4E39_00632 [Methanoregulaceae archaeon PtaB.Bin152]|nr:MAG: hypothetical protein A4E39_00632 [Methanoregulaceae archaeon PtaB.Bin152]
MFSTLLGIWYPASPTSSWQWITRSPLRVISLSLSGPKIVAPSSSGLRWNASRWRSVRISRSSISRLLSSWAENFARFQPSDM